MSRSNKNKIAVTLLSALAFGANDASAMNSGIKTSGNLATKSNFSTSKGQKLDSKSAQTLGTVGGARNQTKKINWKKIAKIGGFSVAGAAALETIHSLIGGFSDSKAGDGPLGRAIRNRVKGNNHPGHVGPGGQDDENSKKNEENNPKINNQLGPEEQGDKNLKKNKNEQDNPNQSNEQNKYQIFINKISEENVNKILDEANKLNSEQQNKVDSMLLTLLSFALPTKLANTNKDSFKPLLNLTKGEKIGNCSFNTEKGKDLNKNINSSQIRINISGSNLLTFSFVVNGQSYKIILMNNLNCFVVQCIGKNNKISDRLEYYNGMAAV